MPTTAPTLPVDRLATGLSALCLLHCLALPVLAAGLPMVSTFAVAAAGIWVHAVLLAAAVPTSCFAFWRGWQQHRRSSVVVTGAGGLALLAAGLAVHADAAAERWLSVAGAALLVLAHAANVQFQRRARR